MLKLSKKTTRKIVRGCGLVMYGVGAALYGYLNYKEGLTSEWNYLSGSADRADAVYIHDGDTTRTDNMYLMMGRKASEAYYNDNLEKKDEQDKE